jgi:4-diphosphocytidyl-2-C-methyl-D-erythritol kinase
VLTVRAHAKINLDLRIVSTRPDGHHELVTVFQSIALHDTLHFTPEDGQLRLSCGSPSVPTDRLNLVWRAAELLWAATGNPGPAPGVHVELVKDIPVQAGLGGGSADAAMTLIALRRLWRLDASDAVLREIASTLGADVAFFLVGGTARGTGRGERLESLPDLPPHRVLLALPGFGVSTAEAYQWYDAASPAPSGPPVAVEKPDDWREAFSVCRNELEPAIRARRPGIAELIGLMEAHRPALAMLSGSGSAVFGLFDGEDGFDAAGAALASAGFGIWKSATLGRTAYWNAAGVGGPQG